MWHKHRAVWAAPSAAANATLEGRDREAGDHVTHHPNLDTSETDSMNNFARTTCVNQDGPRQSP